MKKFMVIAVDDFAWIAEEREFVKGEFDTMDEAMAFAIKEDLLGEWQFSDGEWGCIIRNTETGEETTL